MEIPYKLSFRNLDYFANIKVEMMWEIPIWICEYKSKEWYFWDEFSWDSIEKLSRVVIEAVWQEDYIFEAHIYFP